MSNKTMLVEFTPAELDEARNALTHYRETMRGFRDNIKNSHYWGDAIANVNGALLAVESAKPAPEQADLEHALVKAADELADAVADATNLKGDRLFDAMIRLSRNYNRKYEK